MRPTGARLAVLALASAFVSAGTAASGSPAPSAQPVLVDRVEAIPLQSASPSTKQFLTHDGSARPALIAGELRIPKPGPEKLPVVVLVHGSGGISARQDRWVQELNGIGVATFMLDSFAGRGIVNTVTDQSQLSALAMMVDAFQALAALAKHPRLDPDRIVIMGFSKGAVAAVYSAVDRFQKMYGPPDVAFAAHIGLYTPCNITYAGDDQVSKKPIRLFHGTADDWVAIGPCRAYVERLRKAGADATLTELPGAVHAYDSFTILKPVPYPKAQTTRNCTLRESDGGEILEAKTGKPFDYDNPCVERGTHIVYDAAATDATVRAVKELLTSRVAAKRPDTGRP
jgi:dienelactone hydrolase